MDSVNPRDDSKRAVDLLAEASDLPDHEARRLLTATTRIGPRELLEMPQVPAEEVRRFRELLVRRRSGEPLQYIEGTTGFGPLMLHVDSRALIPRPETEHMWELAVAMLGRTEAPSILDLCTGSGNLAFALRTEFPGARVIATDISVAALDLARENAASLGLDVEFIAGDLFDPVARSLQGTIDMIISNPPYVAAGEWNSLPIEVRDYEPTMALVAGPRGTEILERIADEAEQWLRPGGRLLCEIGETQGKECLALFARYRPEILPDLTGRPRFVAGRAPEDAKLH